MVLRDGVVVGSVVVVVEVTVTVDGSADIVTVLGTGVTVLGGVSVGVGEGEMVASIEKVAVAEKLAPADGAGSFGVETSAGMVVVVSVVGAVLGDSASGGAVPASVAAGVSGAV